MIHLFTDKKSKSSDEQDDKTPVLSFDHVDAREVMTHRSEINAVEGNAPLEACLVEMLTSPNSWYPVYEGNIDTVLGLITVKDAMKEYFMHPASRSMPVSEIHGLLREAAIFPETRSVVSILRYMQTQKVEVVLIVDEYGQISGLISKADILDEIASDILNYDPDPEMVQPGLNNSIIMDGLTPLDKAEEVLHVTLDTDDYETLSGYLTALLGHIPTPKDKTIVGKHYIFHILKVENHTIRKVRAERLPEEESSSGDSERTEEKTKQQEAKE